VLLLAIKTGWSRAEILALNPAEFNHYLNVIVSAKTESP
jgi:hypothetical protein